MTVNPEESAITYRRIDPANDDEFEVAVQVMVSSFSVMPTWTKFYRGKDTSRARAKAIYYLRSVGYLGEIWGTVDIHGKMESVIAFIPPGKAYTEAPSVEADNEAFLETLGEDRVPLPAGPSKTTFLHPTYKSEHVQKESWNIILIGTTPESAGKGLGRRLIQIVLDRADEREQGVWVPTTFKPRIPFYEKLGFVHVKSMDLVSDLGDPASEFHLYRPHRRGVLRHTS